MINVTPFVSQESGLESGGRTLDVGGVDVGSVTAIPQLKVLS